MDNQQVDAAKPARGSAVAVFIAAYLIGTLLWRLFVPAHEYPGRSAQVLEMVFDAGMIAGLFAMKSDTAGLRALFWVALAAGIGLFAIRLTSDASWWTGHLIYRM